MVPILQLSFTATLGRGFNGGASDTFKVDLQDPRFKALVTDPRFALDPTDPEFRRGPGAAQLAQEISKIRSNGKETAQRPGGDLLHGKIPNLPEGGGSSSVKVMVANLKRKAGKFSNKGTGGSKQRKA